MQCKSENSSLSLIQIQNMSNNTPNFSDSPVMEADSSTVTWSTVVLAVILYAVTLFTIFGNILVLIAVKVNKRLQTNFNYYIVNLAITDVGVAITAMSFKATDTVLGYWPFGEAICAMWIFFDYGMTFASVFTLILISVDRFWSVTWTVHYRQHHNRRNCLIAIVLVWVFMVLLWFPPWLLDRVRYSEPGVCYWNPSLNKEFVFVLAALGHHGPFLVLIFCYTYVFLFLRKHAKVNIAIESRRKGSNSDKGCRTTPAAIEEMTTEISTVSCYKDSENNKATESHNGNRTNTAWTTTTSLGGQCKEFSPVDICYRDNKTEPLTKYRASGNFLTVPGTSGLRRKLQTDNQSGVRRLNRERKIFSTLTYITVAYVILWLPFHVVYDISIVNPNLVPEPVLTVAFWLTYLNSTVNPLLYNFSNSEFRRTFRRILRKRW